MSFIYINFNKTIGKIKPVHGVGQPPMLGHDFSKFHYLTEANIPFSRLHDVGGWFGGNMYVDIPNLFRDFNADPNDPDSYDFTFTDILITALIESGIEPFFRLGVTIENFAAIKSYRIDPPKDPQKWAKICEGIIRHYNEGWANGFHYNIRYWEIWNEPDNNEIIEKSEMWRGTKEQYYELYDVTATYLKKQFPNIKIGGYSVTDFYALTEQAAIEKNASVRDKYYITFFDGFLDYIKSHGSPLDFLSWHSYRNLKNTMFYAEYTRRRLDEAGYINTETTCNEWHWQSSKRGTAEHAALNTSMLIGFQHSPVDSAMFYDARLGQVRFGGLFNPLTHTPLRTFYGFKAFGQLYKMGQEVQTICELPDVHILAATDGVNGGILLVNLGEDTPLEMAIEGFKITNCRITDEIYVDAPSILPKVLRKNTVLYIETKSN